MSTTKIVLLGLLGVFIIFIISIASWFMSSYNGMVDSSSQVDTAYAAIQSQYQRRFDLVPNLAEATKGYLKQEQKVFGDIANARTHYAGSATGSKEQIGAMGEYNSALSRLMVIMENYPDLKSNETVKNLMDELSGTENRINVSRDRYNETTRVYNVLIKSFPKNMIAGMFGFTSRELFKADEDAQGAVKINLTN
ncbi:MAG: LemA family protein [Bacilli bacterium]|jgi:LemA protein